jgi:hypothetical protein
MVDNQFRVKLIPQGMLVTQVDPWQQCRTSSAVSALESRQLPAPAQVANQEAKWLGKKFNEGDLDTSEFTFRNLGAMLTWGT